MAEKKIGGKRAGAGRKKGTTDAPNTSRQEISALSAHLPERPRIGRETLDMKKAAAKAQAVASRFVEDAVIELAKLAGLVRDENGVATGMAASDRVRAKCLELVLERAAGKALQPIGGEDGGPLTVVIRRFTQGAGA
jgi:hypothetical protein